VFLKDQFFLIFINDIPAVNENPCKLYADEIKVIAVLDGKTNAQILQDDIGDELGKWSEDWLTCFNFDKCKIMHIGKENPKFEYTMRSNEIVVKLSESKVEKMLAFSFQMIFHVTSKLYLLRTKHI
jgi:hypothetical protein